MLYTFSLKVYTLHYRRFHVTRGKRQGVFNTMHIAMSADCTLPGCKVNSNTCKQVAGIVDTLPRVMDCVHHNILC